MNALGLRAGHGLSLVATNRGYSPFRCVGFSLVASPIGEHSLEGMWLLTGLLLLGSTVSRVCGLLTGGFSCWGAQSLGHVASAVVMRALSCSEACGILLEQRSNLCLLHRQMDSYLLDHQGSSSPVF